MFSQPFEPISQRLVEEFMLLANIAVARHIHQKYPDKAILRRHPSPNSKQITDLSERLKDYGYECNTSTSNSIQVESLCGNHQYIIS
jgi:exoribonuclease R